MESGIKDILRLRANAMVNWKVGLLFSLFFVFGCASSDEEKTSPNGDPSGTFYSLAVLDRFDHGISRETARGEALYSQYCVICHGEAGDGKGFNAYNLKSNFGVEPFDFTDATAQITFDDVKKAINYGGLSVNKSQYMPPWGATFTEYDLACITSYVWHSLIKR